MGRRSPLGVAEALLHFQWLIGKLVDTAAATTANVPLLLSGRFQAETCLRYQAHYSVLLAKTMFCAEGKSMRLPSQAIGDHDDHTQDVTARGCNWCRGAIMLCLNRSAALFLSVLSSAMRLVA